MFCHISKWFLFTFPYYKLCGGAGRGCEFFSIYCGNLVTSADKTNNIVGEGVPMTRFAWSFPH